MQTAGDAVLPSARGLIVEQLSTAVLQVRLNRPDRANALSAELISGLITIVTAAYADRTRLLVLRGEGKHFSAGADRAGEGHKSATDLAEGAMRAEVLLQLLWRAPFVTIALVQGAALGAGCDIVTCCDYRVGGAAAQLGFRGFRLFGVSLGNRRLAEVAGGSVAFDLVLRDRRIGRDEAMRLGLLSHAMDPEAFDGFVVEIAKAVEGVKKASIPLLREATRGTGRGGEDLDRVVRSVAAAHGRSSDPEPD